MRPYIDFRAVVAQITVRQGLARRGWEPILVRGNMSRGRCPLPGCRGRRPRSLCVWPDHWYCHSCRRCGDVIQLWAEMHEVTPQEAAYDLCHEFSLPVPQAGGLQRPKRQRTEGMPPRA